MTAYAEQQSLRQARARYFADNRFGDDGGYGDKWVELKVGPMRFYLRNGAGRVRAVKLHDLHHIATGYQTDWKGEFEISGWEIGGGCGDYATAWLINLGGLAAGLMVAPKRVYQAFVRGRHGTSLYHEGYREELLDETVGALRRRLGTDGPVPPATLGDRLAFLGFAALSVPAGLVQLVGGIVAWPLGQWNRRLMMRERAAQAA
jgi:hypothetical protein